jgi:hypothetical protein
MPGKPGIIPNMGDTTQATQILLGQVAGVRRPTRKRRATKRRATTTRRKKTTTKRRASSASTRRTRRTGGRLKKGSPEAKRRMAQLRRMRGKKRR